jgi:hypothetical protein
VRGKLNALRDIHTGQSLRANGRIIAGNNGNDPVVGMGDGDIAATDDVYVGKRKRWVSEMDRAWMTLGGWCTYSVPPPCSTFGWQEYQYIDRTCASLGLSSSGYFRQRICYKSY